MSPLIVELAIAAMCGLLTGIAIIIIGNIFLAPSCQS
jgi:hypothetical protein